MRSYLQLLLGLQISSNVKLGEQQEEQNAVGPDVQRQLPREVTVVVENLKEKGGPRGVAVLVFLFFSLPIESCVP